ncbi:MAG: CBS domain-containing protein [Acidobacteriota bacterium]
MAPRYVRDLMTEEVITIGPEEDLMAFRDLLYEHAFRHVPVTDAEGTLVGLLSERDLLRNILTDQADVPLSVRDESMKRKRVGDIMTHDVETAQPDDLLQDAAQLMLDNKYGCLPVTENSRLVGIVTEADFVHYFADKA